MACSQSDYQKAEAGDLDALGKVVGCLKADIAELKPLLNNAQQGAAGLSSELGKTSSILVDMKNTIRQMGERMINFTKSTGQQYAFAEKIAIAYKSTGLQMGLAVGRSEDLSKSMKNAMVEASKFGIGIDKINEVYTNFSEQSSRTRILSGEEAANIAKLEKATQLYGTSGVEMMETLDLMGVSNEAAMENIMDMVKDSQSIGLNSSKVSKMMANNMKSMQSYSFVGGVKGMTEMAKQAVKMRIDVSDVLAMSEKFYQPEAAIEAAANLQMLGGDIAKAFGDPFETMYLARNKPEELAKRLEDMTANMLQFNEVTGEYELPAEARMQLKSAGDQLGINTEKMVEMARQSSKIKDIKSKLSGSIFSDDEMEGIASMSKMQDGQFKVDVLGEDGKMVSKSLDELTKTDAELLLKQPKNEEEYQDQMLFESQTTNQRLANIEESFKYGIIEQVDIYKTIEDATQKSVIKTEEMGEAIKDGLIQGLSQTEIGKQLQNLGNLPEQLDVMTSGIIDGITKSIEGGISLDNGTVKIDGDGILNVTGGITTPNVTQPQSNQNVTGCKPGEVWDPNTQKCIAKTQDLVSYPGDSRILTGSFGQIGLDERDLLLAGDPNKITGQSPQSSNNGTTNVNLNGEIRITGAAGAIASIKAPELRKMVVDIINQKDRNGGTITSKEVYDG